MALSAKERRRRRPPKTSLIRFPSRLEISYRRDILNIVDASSERLKRIVRNRYPVALEQARILRGRADQELVLIPETRSRAEEDLEKAARDATIAAILSIGEQPFDDEDGISQAVQESARDALGLAQILAEGMAHAIGNDVDIWNRREVQRQVERALGVTPIFGNEPWLPSVINAWRNSQSIRIRSVPEALHSQVADVIERGVLRGTLEREIIKEIIRITGVSERRAAFIARNQIGNLNAALTKERHQDLGAKEYVWRTMLDDKVRPAHAQLEGQVRKYGVDLFPGEDPNCRCTAEPIFTEEDRQRARGEQVDPTRPPRVATVPRQPQRRAPQVARAPSAPVLIRRGGPTTGPRIPSRPTPSAAPIPPRPAPRPTIPTPSAAPPTSVGIPTGPTGQSVFRSAVDATVPTPRRTDVRRLMNEWVLGSKRKTSTVFKEAVRQEFGRSGTIFQTRSFNINSADIPIARRATRAIYNETQEELRRAGATGSVRLYRGVRTNYHAPGVIESWTNDPAIARRFAGPGGRVYSEDVPTERILTNHTMPSWKNGKFGEQSEWIVMSE